ncbi:MAG: cytochrome P450 [Geminicoccaceae bacterium]
MNMLDTPMVQHSILSDDFRADPYPTFRWWHAHEKAFRDPDQGYWVVFGYEQVRDLLRNSSLTVERYDNLPGSPEEQAWDRHIRSLLSVWMLNVDGDRHITARSTLKPLFSNRALADYEQLIREQVESCLDKIGGDGRSVEAYADIAFPLPARIVLSIMGLGDLSVEELERVRRFSDVISTYVGSAGRAAGCIKPTYDVLNEFCDFLKERIDPEKPGFQRTLTARLLEIYGGGATIKNSPDTLSNIILFIVSGFETTTNLILNSLLAIGRQPELEAEIRRDSRLIEDFIDETLRVYPPVNRTARKVLDEVIVDGQAIQPGALVILFLGAANRDPSVFDDPDVMKIIRPERRSHPVLSFGFGAHLCIGRLLSIMELRIFYEEMLKRYSSLQIDLDSVRCRDGSVLKGISQMSFSASV